MVSVENILVSHVLHLGPLILVLSSSSPVSSCYGILLPSLLPPSLYPLLQSRCCFFSISSAHFLSSPSELYPSTPRITPISSSISPHLYRLVSFSCSSSAFLAFGSPHVSPFLFVSDHYLFIWHLAPIICLVLLYGKGLSFPPSFYRC